MTQPQFAFQRGVFKLSSNVGLDTIEQLSIANNPMISWDDFIGS